MPLVDFYRQEIEWIDSLRSDRTRKEMLTKLESEIDQAVDRTVLSLDQKHELYQLLGKAHSHPPHAPRDPDAP